MSDALDEFGWTQKSLDAGRTRHMAKIGTFTLVVAAEPDGRAS